MRTHGLVSTYVLTVTWLAIAIRMIYLWAQRRDAQMGHLALASGLFGIDYLIKAITTTMYDSSLGESAPRWTQLAADTAAYLAIFFFFVFLADFVGHKRIIGGVAALAAVVSIVLDFMERADIYFDPAKGQIMPIPGVNNPFSYLNYAAGVFAYLAVVFGILWVVFLVYGLAQRGLARLRMVSISGAFLIACIAVGLVPRLLFWSRDAALIHDLTLFIYYLGMAAAPFLYFGFMPPKWTTNRFKGEKIAELTG